MFISTKKLYVSLVIIVLLIFGAFFTLYQKDNKENGNIISTTNPQLQIVEKSEAENQNFIPEKNDKANETDKDAIISPTISDNISPATVSNNKLSWYYMPNKQHRLPEVNAVGKELLSRYGGIYHGNIEQKVVYLTFDEGYENGYTPVILDTLKEKGVQAAFFITGDYLKKNSDLVKRMVAEGHIVGNHTQTHPSLPEVNDERLLGELTALEESYSKVTGEKMKYLRPPMGEYSARTLQISSDLGYINVFWSVAMADWVPDAGTPEQNKNTILARLHNGAVILLHAVNKANAEMLPQLIDECRGQGYQFGSLDDIK